MDDKKRIDSQAKLSPEDYLFLYWYAVLVKKQAVEYEEFTIDEELIENYNEHLEQWEKNFNSDPGRFEKTIIWDKPIANSNYYNEQLQKAWEFESWVNKEFENNGIDLGFYYDKKGQFSGENAFGIEIKRDMKLCETDNIYIEYQEKRTSKQEWVNSGILKKDNSKYWLIGDKKRYLIIEKEKLKTIYDLISSKNNSDGIDISKGGSFRENSRGTSKGFIIPYKEAKKISVATSIEEFIEKKVVYAIGHYYHGKRDCKYIVNKKVNELHIYNSPEEAEKEGYKACTNPKCFGQ